MKFEVTIEFGKSLKRLSKKYKSLKDDYIQFLNELEENPYIGDVKEKEKVVEVVLFFIMR